MFDNYREKKDNIKKKFLSKKVLYDKIIEM